MADVAVKAGRLDPYKNFKFQVIVDGRVVAGISKMGALKRTTEVVEHQDGGAISTLHFSPGTTRFEPILLERVLSHDTTFKNWAERCRNLQGDGAHQFRKDLRINVLNEQGDTVQSYMVYRCWVSEYQALPELHADDNEVAIESVLIQHEGFERDNAVTGPDET